MTALKWILLGGVLTLYLLFGGAVFMVIEQAHEIQQNADFSVLRKDVQEILLKLDREFYQNGTSSTVLDAVQAAKEGVINRISGSCGGHSLLDDDDADETLRWTYYNSVFFAFTAVTTIGYGNLSPTTYWSRIFTMIYALFGIPINGILISGLSNYYASKLIVAHKRSKDKENGHTKSFIFDVIFYMIPGLLVFIVVPAGFFVVIENWTFLDSIYYSFITLTTIGFGDYVAGMGDGHNFWLWLYKVVIIFWIIFGLGYFVMILGFITKGMTHKKVRTVINKRLNTIKTTKEKLVKDIDYMRRVVNELYMMKIKPVYHEKDEDSSVAGDKYCVHERSISTPHIYQSNLSLNFQIGKNNLNKHDSPAHRRRRCSETDLDRIDREKTFEEAIRQAVLPEELLATVVTVLQDNVNQMIDAVEEFEGDENNDDDNDNNEIENDSDTRPPWELGMLTEADEEILLDKNEFSGYDSLEQVVVHSAQVAPSSTKQQGSSSVLSTPQLIHKKVGDIIRKISSGTKESEIPTTRKISRKESDKKAKISLHPNPDHKNESPGPKKRSTEPVDEPMSIRKISNQIVNTVVRKISKESHNQKVIQPNDDAEVRKISKQIDNIAAAREISNDGEKVRKISKENETTRKVVSTPSPRISKQSDKTPIRIGSPSIGHHRVWELDNNLRRGGPQIANSSPHYYSNQIVPDDFTQGRKISSAANSTCSNSRKISKENQDGVIDGQNELNAATLSDLLRALDSIHHRLKGSDSSDRVGKIPSSSGPCNAGTSANEISSGKNVKNTTGSTNNNDAKDDSVPKRRRKLGVFNPDFSFINQGFQPDEDNDKENENQDDHEVSRM